MAYAVYRNPNRASRAIYPYLLEVQADLLRDLASTVVVPLARPKLISSKPVSGLMPMVRFKGEPYVLMTPELAGVARSLVGKSVGTLAGRRNSILAALDLLLTGV